MLKQLSAVIVAALLAAAVLAILAVHSFLRDMGDAQGLTAVLVVGVISLVAVIALIAAVYNWLGLTDSSQALALPDGSVRSVIALLLLLIFSMLAMFFYEDMQAGTNTLRHQTQADVMAFIAKNPGAANLTITLEAATPAPTNTAEPSNEASNAAAPSSGAPTSGAAPNTPPPLYTISYGASSVAADFAKQLMAGLQALLTTVVGFYFGAKTAASAAAATAQQLTQSGGDPAPKSATPNPWPESSPQGSQLTVSGLNLNSIVHAQLEKAGAAPVALTGVTSSPSEVKGALAVTPDMQGQWDVALYDASGKSWKTPQPLTISA